MLLNQRELRYRSIKYSISSSQLLRPLRTPTNHPERFSLTKENVKTQPSYKIQLSHKPSSFFKQSTNHQSHYLPTRSSNYALSRKDAPHQSNIAQTIQGTHIDDSFHCSVLPYSKHYEELQSISQSFPEILRGSSSEIKTIRKQLQFLTVRVQQQLIEVEQLVAVGSRALLRQMELSLKQHNKVAVNARDRVEITGQLYQQTKTTIAEMSLSLEELQRKYNS